MLLRRHNIATYERIKALFQSGNRVCCVQPTGTGKSFLMLQLIADNQSKKFLLCSPSSYIFSQIQVHAENNKIPLENCSYLTYTKLSQLPEIEIKNIEVDYIILDEFHRLGSPEWGSGAEKLLSTHTNAKVLGTSATPIRYLDSMRNMAEELFQSNYAVNMTLAEAIYRKILPLPVYVTSFYRFSGDIARLEQRAENSTNPRLRKVLLGKIRKAKTMIADLDCGIETIFSRHIKNKNGKFIVFCSNVEALIKAYNECEDWFSDVNLNAHKYRVYSASSDAKQNYESFRNDNDKNSLKLLFCVDMLNEGVHIEDIDGVIMLRTTQSANVFYQQLGRALACSENCKNPVIFDLVNNYETGDTANQYAQIMEIGRNYGEGENDTIEFELYDYVRDIREILNELHNSFENSWEIVFEAVSEFKEKQGRFPLSDEKYEGLRVGVWCTNQRILNNKGQLETEKLEKLNSIGFVWDTDEERWQSNYLEIKKMTEQYGHFPKRSDFSADEGKWSLYVWLTAQRVKFGRGELSEEKQKLLNDIGFELNTETNDERWNRLYLEAKKFNEENNRFPTTTDVKKYPEMNELYRWIIRQRKAFNEGKLSEDRVKLLNELGMVWDLSDAKWNGQLELLNAFIRENKRTPSANEKFKNKAIGQWYSEQLRRLKSGSLDEVKVKKITAIAPEKPQASAAWEKKFELLKEFIKEHDRLPYSKEKYRNTDLYLWLLSQKKMCREGNLPKELIDRFAELDIDIAHFSSTREMPQKRWIKTFHEYKKFVADNHRKPSAKEQRLYHWQNLMRMRYKKGNLKESQIDMLRDIGVIDD